MKPTTKTLLIYLTSYIVWVALTFLSFASVKADINPFHWPQDERLLFVFIGNITGAIISLIPVNIFTVNNDPK